jgi:hypothetical protein
MILNLLILVSGINTDTSFLTKKNIQVVNPKFELLDTINIFDPILIEFRNYSSIKSSEKQWLVVSKSDSVKIPKMDTSIKIKEFYFTYNSYFFLSSARFYCIYSQINHSDFNPLDSNIFHYLKFNLLNSEKDTVYVIDISDTIKNEFNGWRYINIYPRKFLLFNVRGDILRKCQTIDEIVIKDMDDSYFRVLTPLSW